MTSIAPAEPSPQPIAERAAKAPIHVIRPWQTGVIKQFTDVIVWRRLMKFYGVSYMLRRVRKTWLGWIWIPLKPGIDILSRTFFFHQVLGAKSGDRPYFIFIAFGTAGWTIFHSVSHWATRAMRMSRVILKNAYVPRLTRLLAVLYPAALDFFMNSIVAIGAIFYYWFTRGKLYVNPLSLHSAVGFGGILLVATFGIVLGMFTAPLSAYAKDVRYTITYLMQIWYFVTPIAQPLSQYHGVVYRIAEFNPITAPLMLVQWGFLGTSFPPTASVLTSIISITVLALAASWVFGRFETMDVKRL